MSMLLPSVYNLGYSAGKAFGYIISHHTLPPIPSPQEVGSFLWSAPSLYKAWWLNLVTNDPVHVFIETTLLLSVVYMIVSNRKKDWRKTIKVKLTKAEEEELLRDWKENIRTPLITKAPPAREAVVVHAMEARTMDITEGDNQERKKVLNFATHDFLAMSANQSVKDASVEALTKYGCGSCGPRGFYGTIDAHLDLEEAFAKFAGTEGAIMYSDGASGVSSTVAAFAKRGDLVVVDDGVSEPLLTGITLSRANVKWFKHNDMADLRRVLESVRKKDKALGRKPNDQKRFLIVEGLYRNSGSIVPLDEVVAMKHEFEYRLFLDESFSYGTLGKTGRGTLELFGLKIMYDVEFVTIGLENAFGAIGGMTIGNEAIVDHQRLSGAGYCFSASSPPFTAIAAIQSLSQLENNPALLTGLTKNIDFFNQKIKAFLKDDIPNQLEITSDERSPLVFAELAEKNKWGAADHDSKLKVLEAIAHECLRSGVALVCITRPLQGNSAERPPPALRWTVSTAIKEDDMDEALRALKSAVQCIEI